MRQVKEYVTEAGERRYKVRYRLGGAETSETFRRRVDAETFRDILGDGRHGRTVEALKWLQAKQEERDTFTFAEWHELYVQQLTGVTPRTRDDYRAYRRRYLSDLDPLPLPLIARSHVAALVNRLEAEGKSPKTIKNVVHMLSSCMALAVDEGHATTNPCRRVRLPKNVLNVHEARFLTPEEVNALVHALPAHYRPLIVFMVGTGTRWSEATAVQARHVDLTNGTVRVEQAWKVVKGGRVLGPPKSSKSRRTVNAAVSALLVAAPLLGRPNDFVFTTRQGRPIAYSNFYDRVWRPACKRAGLDPSPGLHSLRHTFASWLISDGQPLEAVQDQLGHESILTTRAVYAHLQPAVGVAAGRSASEALARALGDSLETLALAPVTPVATEAAHGSDQAGETGEHAPDVQDRGDG